MVDQRLLPQGGEVPRGVAVGPQRPWWDGGVLPEATMGLLGPLWVSLNLSSSRW